MARGRVFVGTQHDGLVCVGRSGKEEQVPLWLNRHGGAGAGGGTGVRAQPARAGEEAVGEGGNDSGYGMGYGLRATPAGVYVIKGGEVEWKPALDMNRLTLQRTGVAILALLVLRSIIRTLAKR